MKLFSSTKEFGSIVKLIDMKKRLFALFAAVLSFAACQDIEPVVPDEAEDVIKAWISQDDEVKTFLGEDNKALWMENDQVAAFMMSSALSRYQIQSQFVGNAYAEFTKVADVEGQETAVELAHNVAYYPFSENIKYVASDNGYSFKVELPSEQMYAKGSFGNAAFPMAAVSVDNNFIFTNVCGGVKLLLTGNKKVTSVQIQGNNDEKLSGAAVVTAYTDDTKPSIEMAADASVTVTLNCAEGVQLNESTPTEFIIALPPVTFTKGFTVTITDADNKVYLVETEKSNTVLRSGILVMPDVKVENEFTPIDIVPVVRINVEDGKDIDSKDTYRNVTITISEGEDLLLSAVSGRAKGRGNATWGYEKKPYKIKFDKKQEVLGFAANKDWVLLADYCDRSLMRTAYMCELARISGHPYPINYRHVQLYLNDKYVGLYVLTDQVEKKSNRVDIEDDGYLFENDNYYWMEPLQFKTSTRSYWYTFKYPDPEDGEIAVGDDKYNYITGFMDEFETALYGDNFKDPENGYRKYVDVETFAKWFLVQELIANLEPNMYYVLPTRGAKLQIGPLWDAEWSLGLAGKSDESAYWDRIPAQPDRYKEIWTKWKYYGRLFQDEYFVNVVRSEWETLKAQLPSFMNKMDAVAKSISEEQVANFEKWQILGKEGLSVVLVCQDTWEKEVEYVKDFFTDRIECVDNCLQAF